MKTRGGNYLIAGISETVELFAKFGVLTENIGVKNLDTPRM